MSDLTDDEYVDLWKSVRHVQSILSKHFAADTDTGSNDGTTKAAVSFNIGVQDGKSAGQSVPHVHVHILPRADGDFERNDDVYDELEHWAPRDEMRKDSMLVVLEDEDRRDRTQEQMADEASRYREIARDMQTL